MARQNKGSAELTSANATGITKILIQMRKHWQIYVLVIPALVWYIIFAITR